MSNGVTQNPANRAARNSGAGRAGIDEIVPTEREARRGLEAMGTTSPTSWRGFGLGAVAAVGAGLGAFAVRRIRARRGWRARVRDWAGLG